MSVGSRLRIYLEYKNVSRNIFSEIIEIKYSSLSRIINGNGAMNSDTLEKIFTYFPELNTRWFITGKGPMEYPAGSYYIDKEMDNQPIREIDYSEKLLRNSIQKFLKKEEVINALISMFKEENTK
ncbi:helix-turn-helix transcriptional regulator [Myroides odoratimimus]|uniref:helix-turn-helix domain-containing protein n=1 Tax=Myroides odoratimimus TaxID=76832 RepID=UPI0025750BAB|nr:helix-turn-helix transcriptional regulator [Myroides odoratimimus]MDM1441883.1 helix-turn-helix transcriptional regulator [Myroides odoratimimus]